MMQLVHVSQLHPAEWNPRSISEKDFEKLCKSIEEDPKFLELRPILATKEGEIYAGNMRYRAAVKLGMTQVPAILEDVSEKVMKERAIKDNNQWGTWDEEKLGEVVYEIAEQEGEIANLGFDQERVDEIVGNIPDFQPDADQAKLDEKDKIKCPECGHEFTR